MFSQLTPDWFVPECFAQFCDKLDEEEKSIHEPVLEHVPRKSQRIRNAKLRERRSREQVVPQHVTIEDDSNTSSYSRDRSSILIFVFSTSQLQ